MVQGEPDAIGVGYCGGSGGDKVWVS